MEFLEQHEQLDGVGHRPSFQQNRLLVDQVPEILHQQVKNQKPQNVLRIAPKLHVRIHLVCGIGKFLTMKDQRRHHTSRKKLRQTTDTVAVPVQ